MLRDWKQTELPSGAIRLCRRYRDADRLLLLPLFGVGGLGLLLVDWLTRHTSQTKEKWMAWHGSLLFFALVCLGFGMLALWARRRWFREEFRLGENWLEQRLRFGRWRRVTRITEGWVYLEKVELRAIGQHFRVRVRGSGGELVLMVCPRFDGEDQVPQVLLELAEFVAQKTEWRLDIPYGLRF